MKTRGKKTACQENDVYNAKPFQRSTRKKASPESPLTDASNNVEKRAALREKTNLSRLEVSSVNTSLKESCRGKAKNRTPISSPKQLHVTLKVNSRKSDSVEISSKSSSPKENSFRKKVRMREDVKPENTPKGSFVTPKVNRRRSSLSNCSTATRSSTRNKCVYMRPIPEEEVVKEKEELYEFVADKNEPPSRRRRRKRTVKKPAGFTRKRIPSNSDGSLAGTSSNLTSFASSTSSSVFKPVKKSAFSKKDQPSSTFTSFSSTSSSVLKTVPSNGDIRNTQNPVPMVDPSSYLKCHRPLFPAPSNKTTISSTPIVTSTKTRETVTAPVNLSSIVPTSIEFSTQECSTTNQVANDSISEIPVPPCTINLPETPVKSSFYNSSMWSERPSISLGLAKLHSTPCKARSGSDSSSCFQLEENLSNKENCFGFSSDEDETLTNMPSPLHLSPHSHAQRHTLLSPPNAPTRFSPHLGKRALGLTESTNRLNIDGYNFNQHKRRLQFKEKKAEPVKAVKKRCNKKTKVEREENIALALKAMQEKECEAISLKLQETPSQIIEPDFKNALESSSVAEGLFDDMEERDGVEVTFRRPRRSYERTLKKRKKVIGGGLCLVSDDEGELPVVEVEKEDKKMAPEVKNPPKVHRKRLNNAEKMEKELDHWASLMNTQFGEVEGFDLCVDKP